MDFTNVKDIATTQSYRERLIRGAIEIEENAIVNT